MRSPPRPALRGPALAGSAVVGLGLVAATLGGALAVLVAAALLWLWWGRPLFLAAVFATAIALAAWGTRAAAASGTSGSEASTTRFP